MTYWKNDYLGKSEGSILNVRGHTASVSWFNYLHMENASSQRQADPAYSVKRRAVDRTEAVVKFG